MFSSADGSIGYLYKKNVTNREIPTPSVGPTVVTHNLETQLFWAEGRFDGQFGV